MGHISVPFDFAEKQAVRIKWPRANLREFTVPFFAGEFFTQRRLEHHVRCSPSRVIRVTEIWKTPHSQVTLCSSALAARPVKLAGRRSRDSHDSFLHPLRKNIPLCQSRFVQATNGEPEHQAHSFQFHSLLTQHRPSGPSLLGSRPMARVVT